MPPLIETHNCRDIIEQRIGELPEDVQIHLKWWMGYNEERLRNAGSWSRLLYRSQLNRVVEMFDMPDQPLIEMLKMVYDEQTTDPLELESRGYDLSKYGVKKKEASCQQ